MTKKLIPGEKTPSLVLETLSNNLWSLDDNINKTKSLIVFYRGLHCPVCSEFLKLLDIQLEDYKKSKTKWLLFQWIIWKKQLKPKKIEIKKILILLMV